MGSVADPGRFIPDPGILIFIHPGSWISDTGSNNTNKRGGRKKNLLSYVFLQTKALKNMGWDQGSEIRDLEKTFSGSRTKGFKKAADPGPAWHLSLSYSTNPSKK
jgi:hypothetical protein